MKPTRGTASWAVAWCLAATLVGGHARADAEGSARFTFFREPSTANAGVTVYHPQVDVSAAASEGASVSAGYELDVVTGATPRIFQPRTTAQTVDALTGASKFSDERHAFHGGLGWATSLVGFEASYSYGFEHDYRSQTISGVAHGDFLDRNFTLSLAFTHNFDSVCDNSNGQAQNPIELQPLGTSTRCFASGQKEVVTRKLAIDAFEPALVWTATPRLLLQLGGTLQILDGFQSNPYRTVSIGSQHRAPQEHEPTLRQRYALFLRANYAIPAWRASISVSGRAYRDSWDVRAGTGDVVLQRYLVDAIVVALRGRYHQQSGAVFYRNAHDYETLGPAGQYWTGDRELSPMSSYLAGVKLAYLRKREQRPNAFFEETELNVKFDTIIYNVNADAPNADRKSALIGQVGGAVRF